MIIIRGPNNQCGPPAKRPRAPPLLTDRLFFFIACTVTLVLHLVVTRVHARRCIPGGL